MIPSAAWPIDDRDRRHVRHTRLCISQGAPRHRLVAALEEALRLAVLPGESEGRTYFFRHLRLTGLPADGDRRIWLDQFQRTLTEIAADGVHGADPRSGLASAVFFRSRQEALEILLHRLLAQRTVPEWFWPMLLQQTACETGSQSTAATIHGPRALPIVVEALHSMPAGWVSVASALFAAPRIDVVYLLRAIPEAAAQSWLQEMDGRRPVSPPAEPRISPPAQRAVHEALRVFGCENPRTLWLTALAILHESPAEIAAGTVVQRARMALQWLVEQGYPPCRDAVLEPEGPSLTLQDETRSPAPGVDYESLQAGAATEAAPTRGIPPSPPNSPSTTEASPQLTPGISAPPSASASSIPPSPDATPTQTVSGNSRPANAEPASAAPVSEPALSVASAAPLSWFVDGLPTQAAGLFFLLNALERIGMPQAAASGLVDACPDFLPRLFNRVSLHAGISAADPIAAWLTSVIAGPLSESTLRREPQWWPSNLASPPASISIDYLLRAWFVALRRWCCRTGRISLREVVARPGVFSVNRTDLDVSLPLEDAEIRIRRIGLDLDPGWLPWFGRVVRFHYLYPGEFHA